MNWIKYIIGVICCVICVHSYAQNDRDYIRSGNRYFHSKEYAKAEAQYRKAITKNGGNTIALYNLGNALLAQGKPKDAMKMYEKMTQMEKNKIRLAKAYHNMGVIFQSQKNFQEAINCYKNALRRNPHDNETRYNLALCQRQQKDNPPQKNKQQDKKNNKNKDKGNNKDKDSKEKDRQKQQQSNNQNQMSKDNAEQLLNAVMQDERSIQDKMKKMQRTGGKSLEKNW